MKVLITGATGFVGSHLIEFILGMGGDITIYAAQRRRSNIDSVRHLYGHKRIKWVTMDITDSHSVAWLVENYKPDRCFHLAAQSFVPSSWNAPQETMTTNVIGTINLLEAIRTKAPDTLVQIAGSSEEYGMVAENEVPIRESNPLRPLSPYGVSKVAQTLLGYQYFKSYGVKTFRTRGFNHTGPRRGDMFVCSNFAKQLVEIEMGINRENIIRVGNLSAKRDFTDVRDMVRAYWLAVEKGMEGDVYNICSGRSFSVGEVLDMLIGFSPAEIKVEPDPEKMRPSDVPNLLGDNSKFRRQTGWEPQIPFKQTLKDILDYWRETLSRS